jgi:zinc protease
MMAARRRAFVSPVTPALCTLLLFACAPSAKETKTETATASAVTAMTVSQVAKAPPPSTPDAAFRAAAPAPSAGVEFHAPIPKELALKNGLKVFLIERHEVPLVSVALTVRSGADTVPPAKAGLASLVLDLLDEGTATRDAAAIAKAFEDLAARYKVQPDADASNVAVTALADTLDPVMEIFADVALHPVFRDADVERVRTERLGIIAQALDDPQAVGQHVLSRVVFGDQHPWAFPAEGTVKSIKSIARKDLIEWHKAYFRPDNAALFVVGDTDAASLLAILEKRFGAWKSPKAPKAAARTPAKAARSISLIDKPGAPQSQIWIGELGVASTASDIFAVRVMNHILGGSFNSRLNGNLRSEHAYSYGAFSFFDTHRDPGAFAALAGVVSEKTPEALGEFLKELTRMKTGEVTDAELTDAKTSLQRSIPAFFVSTEQTANAYSRAWMHGLPPDYYEKYQSRVEAVSKDDVARAARERLHPDQMAIVIVGPEAAIAPKIAALNLGKIERRDPEGAARKAAP